MLVITFSLIFFSNTACAGILPAVDWYFSKKLPTRACYYMVVCKWYDRRNEISVTIQYSNFYLNAMVLKSRRTKQRRKTTVLLQLKTVLACLQILKWCICTALRVKRDGLEFRLGVQQLSLTHHQILLSIYNSSLL